MKASEYYAEKKMVLTPNELYSIPVRIEKKWFWIKFKLVVKVDEDKYFETKWLWNNKRFNFMNLHAIHDFFESVESHLRKNTFRSI